MQYTASEIIERAKNLADCGNTDFLSEKEATQYINDAYNYVYQKLIDRGDKFFLKRMKVDSGIYPLPSDFYQLAQIKDPVSGFVLTRRAGNASINVPGYDIINNKLIISGTALHNLEMSYFPNPTYITINSNEQDIARLPKAYTDVYGIYGSYYAYTTEDGFAIYDWVNEQTSAEVEFADTINKFYVSRSSVYIITDTNILVYDFDGNLLLTRSNEDCVLIRLENGTIKVEAKTDNQISYRGKTITLELEPDMYIAATDGFLFYRNDGKLYIQGVEEEESIEIEEADDNFIATRVNGKAGVLFFNNKAKIFVINWSKVETVNADFDNFIGFYNNKEYGMIYTDGVEFYKRGVLPETVFNYPNNAYYTLIAYIIATYIVAKQGGDVSILAAQKEKAEIDFEDNCADGWTAVRIKNVY